MTRAVLETVFAILFLTAYASAADIRVAEQRPSGPVVADILYIHGYGDRLDNHAPLFKAWTDAGMRVLALDLPSHGESKAWLDFYGFKDLAKLVQKVEHETREDLDRPFFLAGWSTGGLIAVRTVQSRSFPKLERKVSGMILIAPGVSVQLFVGEWGIITERTLSSNPHPPHVAGPSPVSPFLTPVFSTNLYFVNSYLARTQPMPRDIPLIVFTADDELDDYAISPEVRDWALWQRNANSVPIVGIHCPGARHELDNEPQPASHSIGQQVRDASVYFYRAVIEKRDVLGASYHLGSCLAY